MKKFFLNKKINAFTLIELIVVIAIIGILASVIYPSFVNYQKRSRDARRQVDIKTIVDALERYYVDNGDYPYPEWSRYGNFSDLEPYLVPKYLTKLPRDPLNNTFNSNNFQLKRSGQMNMIYNYYYFKWDRIKLKGAKCFSENFDFLEVKYVLNYALESTSTILAEYCKDSIVKIPPDPSGNEISVEEVPFTPTYIRFLIKR